MSKLVFVAMVGVVLLGGLTGAKWWPWGQAVNYQDISSTELKEMLKNKDFWLVNVHVPYEGEIELTDAFVAYDQIENNLDKLPVDKKAKIVLYCRSGRMSEIAAKTLVGLGYTNVYNLLLGMHDWQANGYPLKL